MMPDLYDQIEGVLRERLGDQSSKFVRVTDDRYPFLLLVAAHDVAGFVILNGRSTEVYEVTYAKFKDLNRQHQDAWKGKTLSFVLCTTEDTDTDSSFLSELEMDVYFCKKYIIRYSDAVDTLHSEILRLPFVPLTDDKPGGILRPVSAQTLLQLSGVDAALAEQLVVPRTSSKRILDDLVQGKLTLAELQKPTYSGSDSRPHRPKPIRVTSLSIEGFRAYKKQCDFDLDADIVVLFGPNGLGKTSFFDALDFACTGRIGRLCTGRIDRSRFVNFARHLDTSPDLGIVTLGTISKTELTTFVRRINDWNHACVMNDRLNRTEVLQRLSSANWPEKKPRIENLEKLFRATHLFSQTDSELFSTFSSTSVIHADLVARMLALDDYASGLSKTTQVLDILKKRLTDLSAQNEMLATQMKELQEKQKRLGPHDAAQSSPNAAKRIAEEIRKATLNIPDLDFGGSPLTIDLAREWRGLLQASADRTKARLAEAVQLQDEITAIQAAEKDERDCKESLERLNENVKKNRQEHTLLTKKIEKARSQIQELQVKTEEVKQHRTLISEVKVLQKQLPVIMSEEKELIAKIEQSEKRRSEVVTNIKKLDLKLNELSEENRRTAKLLSSQKTKQKALNDLIFSAKQWNADCNNSKELAASVGSLQARQKFIRKEHKDTEKMFIETNNALVVAEQKYKHMEKDVSELTELLDQMEQYVTSSICPLCGFDHKTKKSLLSDIRAQKQVRSAPVDSAAKKVQQLLAANKRYEEVTEKLRNEELGLEKSLRETSDALAIILEQMHSFQASAEALGFDTSSPSFSQDIHTAATEADSAVNELLTSKAVQERKRREKEAERAHLIEEREKLDLTLTQSRSRSETVKSNLQDLIRKITEAGIQSDSSEEDFTALLQAKEDRLKVINSQMVELRELLSKHEGEISKLDTIFHRSITEKKSIEESHKIAAKRVMEFANKLQSMGLSPATPYGQLMNKIAELTLTRNNLDVAVEKALFLETLLDTAAKSAAIADIEKQMKEISDRQQETHTEKTRLAASRRFFNTVSKILGKQQEKAVASHIEAYGPLTTTIQKRLRAAYGFGDISLESRKDEIHVTVSWGPESVPPTDYFSESQKQILMLSLFLAGRLTQTWSGFAPILMDDPVTHFDDLNAYAFVELLRGLLETGSLHRQFFVSTCEERLFSLMREKLSGLNGRSKFYHFQAMTANGPEVIPV